MLGSSNTTLKLLPHNFWPLQHTVGFAIVCRSLSCLEKASIQPAMWHTLLILHCIQERRQTVHEHFADFGGHWTLSDLSKYGGVGLVEQLKTSARYHNIHGVVTSCTFSKMRILLSQLWETLSIHKISCLKGQNYPHKLDTAEKTCWLNNLRLMSREGQKFRVNMMLPCTV